MKSCGIELKGNNAIIVGLEGSKSQLVVSNNVKKIELPDMYDNNAVGTFYQKIAAELQDFDCIVIKKRPEKGKFAGGPITFKMEGLIQLCYAAKCSFISSPQVNALIKKNDDLILPELNKDQEQAFFAAYSALTD